MIVVRGKRIINTNGGTPPVNNELVTLVITFNSTPLSPTALFADMKYNKKSGMMLVKDDGAKEDYTQAFAVLHGGFPASNGITYPGIRYTDGCGNPVEYHYTFAINDAIVRGPLNPGAATWDDYKAMFPYDYRLSNHTWAHGGGDKGYDKYYQIRQNELSIYNNSGGQRTRTFVIPTADEGYSFLAPYLGYKLIGSTFGSEEVADDDGNLVQYSSAIDVKTINQARIDRFLFSRAFAANWEQQDLEGLEDLVNRVITDSASGAKKVMGHMFSHQLDRDGDITNFITFLNYIKNHSGNQDTMWMPNMAEFVEYYETKLNVVKSQSVVGNKMTITLNLAGLSKAMEYRDMSLLISGGTINNVEVTNATVTFNPSSGLINVFNRNLTIKDPNTDVVLPQILSAVVSGTTIVMTFSRAITQTQFSNSKGAAYKVLNNTVLSVTGSGTVWTINCQAQIGSGKSFDYRMQRGNAADINGLKVPTYIGYPLN